MLSINGPAVKSVSCIKILFTNDGQLAKFVKLKTGENLALYSMPWQSHYSITSLKCCSTELSLRAGLTCTVWMYEYLSMQHIKSLHLMEVWICFN